MTLHSLDVADLRVETIDKGVAIVEDVSFAVDSGEVLGLVGESGSGKTTVALALLGYARRGLRIVTGTVRQGSVDVLALEPAALRSVRGKSIAYIPQDPTAALNPSSRVGSQLADILDAHRPEASEADKAQRIAEMMEEVQLPGTREFLRRFPHQLSGGQQQRVTIAMAFACQPSVVVMDEPTTGLDVTTQAHVLRTLKRMCSEHQTAAVYVTHDLAVVAGLANMVVVMYAGRIVETGLAGSIFASSAHPYTRGLVRAIPDLTGRRALKGVPGSAPAPNAKPDGCKYHPRCEFAVERCQTQEPPMAPVGARHVVRCIRAREVLATAAQTDDAAVESRSVAQSADSLLTVSEVRAGYGSIEVLHGIDLELKQGECLAIVGESGSGKTTLARCVAGLRPITAGTIELGGERLASTAAARSRETCRQIQYVFQNPYESLNPRYSIEALLSVPLNMYFKHDSDAEKRRKIAQALEQVSLPVAMARRYPDQLSGGQRQRVAIARALVAQPRVLICDEITSALDVSVQAMIIELLTELQRSTDLAMLFVTHNLALVRSVAQRVAVLMNGDVVEHGPAGHVLDNPRTEYTQRLLADIPESDVAVRFTTRAPREADAALESS